MRRVVVTGLGVASAVGTGIAPFWTALAEGRCGIGPITNIATDRLGIKIAAEIKDFDPAAHFDAKRVGMLDRFAQLALVASRQAVAQSGLTFSDGLGERTATILGTGAGGTGSLDDSFKKFYGENSARVHPFTIPRMMNSAAASHVTMEHGLTGPAFSISSACSSASHAIGHAFQLVRAGLVDAAVTGGTEASLTPGAMKGWEAMRVLSSDGCRPFSKNRNGLVLGEGAAILVLESLEIAHARGANILAEILGVGMTADARDITTPDVTGASRAMVAALADARLNPEDVDYINAHGTGTAANDATETRAIHQAFGFHARRLAVSSSKSIFGHTLGAAGALEMVATIEAIRHSVIPPTLNYSEPDPDCDLDYVPNTARTGKIRVALSNTFAFGGLNATLVVAGI